MVATIIRLVFYYGELNFHKLKVYKNSTVLQTQTIICRLNHSLTVKFLSDTQRLKIAYVIFPVNLLGYCK